MKKFPLLTISLFLLAVASAIGFLERNLAHRQLQLRLDAHAARIAHLQVDVEELKKLKPLETNETIWLYNCIFWENAGTTVTWDVSTNSSATWGWRYTQ